NLVFHSKTKHIEIRHHFIRDAYEKKLIQELKIHTDDNVADLLTKAFDVSRRWTLDDMMMIWGSLYSFLMDTYGAELVSAACLINIARPKLCTARLGWCCSKVFNNGVDAWIGSMMQFGLELRVLNGNQQNTASSQIVNDEKQIHATVDSKAIVVTEESIRSYLLLNDVVGDQPPVTASSSSHDTTQASRDSLEGTNRSEGDQVQPSHDSPFSSDHTSEKAEGGFNLEELFVLCTNLSNSVPALETSKDT
ncbi:hypothetical protein Tco_0260516, partial [Tanacetum coccineum]